MLLVNIFLLLTLVLLFSPLLTGLLLHEITGIAFFVLLIMHLLFSWDWIQKIRARLKIVQWPIKLGYFVNTLLFIVISLQLISGLTISQFVLPFFGVRTINDWVWRELHNLAYQISILLTCLHISINMDRIVRYLRGGLNNTFNWNLIRHLSYVSFRITIRRVLLILCWICIVGLLAWFFLGSPIKDRLHPEDEIKRFQPMLIPGLVQFFGGFVVLAILTYMARRWIKIRL